jgi:glyoxylase-like metal-dependent hydrolase (beta-lactamase superfamily II)
VTRWLFAKDKPALRKDLLSLAATENLVRVLPGHGKTVASDAAARLRIAAERI